MGILGWRVMTDMIALGEVEAGGGPGVASSD
jgi:hypothetical protein